MNQVSIKRCRPLLGTFVEVNLTAKMSEKALIHWSNMAFDEIERIHQTLSFHQLDSELSALNIALITAPNAQFTMSADLQNVVTFAQQVFEHSNGYYDISIAAPLVASKHLPAHLFTDKAALLEQQFGCFADVNLESNLISSTKPIFFDLGGIAKGYAVDQAISLLPNEITGSINAGGDLRVINWQKQKVEIKYSQRNSALKKLPMLNTALASSGSYYQENGSQYFDPKAKCYVKVNGSTSVFADKAMVADALTKIIVLMNRKDAEKVLNHFNAKGISINRFGFSRRIN
ncbi:FAD:protein FMN transferase [Cognaticolwellia mytili]|uniref:FAD:protein FMN transferase n=1 Tax=Cognaticolwellia mytili TaxID=1888913 RepID=UPI000A16F85F|nr:FAD:protein FMN transferase [Cognaticolwellia mytili]